MATTNAIKDLLVTHDAENGLLFEKNISLLWHSLMLYSFVDSSFSEVNAEHKSKYSAWETPDSIFWTKNGYVVVRATSVVSGNLLASWIQCRKEQANVSLTRLNGLPNSHGLLEKSDF